MDYRLARTYEESGYKIIPETIRTENNKLYADVECNCYRCGGKGQILYFGHIDNGICFACGGRGKFYKKHCRVYTTEEREKMDAAAATKKERELEKQKAEAPAKRQAWLDKYNISNGIVLVVAGCNTYNIKDELKEKGAKFYSGLGWFFGTDTAPNEISDPNAFLFQYDIEKLMYWNEVGGGPYFLDGALDEMKADIKQMIASRNKETSNSQFVGEIGERLRNMKATFVSSRYFEGNWGGSFVYTFEVNNNIFTWFTQKMLTINEGDVIDLTGTVKNHTEYNGILQTQLSRCIIKEAK